MHLNDFLDYFIFIFSPTIVVTMLGFAHYIWRKKISQGANGIYKCMMYTGLWQALNSLLVFEFYLLDSLNFYTSDNWIGTGVRLYRALLTASFFLIVILWYLAVTVPVERD